MISYENRKELYREMISDFLNEYSLEDKDNRDRLFSFVEDLIELEILLGMEQSDYEKN